MADEFDLFFGDSDSDASFEGFDEQDIQELNQDRLGIVDADNPINDRDFPSDLNLKWSREASENFAPPFTGASGINVEIDELATPIEYFKLFITDDEFDLISTETNRYFNQIRAKKQPKPHARMNSYYDTSPNEMKKFFGMTVIMGLVEKPRVELYWSTDDIDETPFFNQCMPRDRFLNLLSFLHLTNNETAFPRGEPEYDAIYKVRPIYDVLSRRFRSVYTPDEHVSIDEAMVPWRGRLRFRQYIPNKPDKFGIKLYPICESKSSYVCDFDVYTGADYEPNPGADNIEQQEGHSYHVVMGLLRRVELLNKGYSVYVDNYYSSPILFDNLYAEDTLAVGTVRVNRREMPVALKNTKLKKGETVYRQRGHLLAIKWHDKRDVTMLSTKHNPTMSLTNKVDVNGVPILKPTCILDYNRHMGGVDIFDQLGKYYTFSRKTLKWWVKLLFHLINLAITNAYIIYRKNHRRPMSQYKFRKQLGRELINCHNAVRPARNRPARNEANERRLTEKHFPDIIPAKEGAKVKNPTRKCVVCNVPAGRRRAAGEPAKRRETRYWCSDCKKPLCVAPCFRRYHTIKNYKGTDTQTQSSSSDSN